VPATFSLVAWVVTFIYLKETVPHPTPVKEFLGLKKKSKIALVEEEDGIIRAGATVSNSKATQKADGQPDLEKPLPLRSLLTRRVIIAAGNYATLSLVDIAFRAVQPLFLSTPIHLGGLGLPPSTIGKLLSIFGILNGIFQVFFFAQVNDHFGSRNLFICGIASALPAFGLFPLINYLAKYQGYSVMVWSVVLLQIVISIGISLSYGKPSFSIHDVPLFILPFSLFIFRRGYLYLHLRCGTQPCISGCNQWS